jgi:hypothetical protein
MKSVGNKGQLLPLKKVRSMRLVNFSFERFVFWAANIAINQADANCY